jgi:hypothetical protein
MKGKNC